MSPTASSSPWRPSPRSSGSPSSPSWWSTSVTPCASACRWGLTRSQADADADWSAGYKEDVEQKRLCNRARSQMINLIKVREICVKSVKLCRAHQPGVTTARPRDSDGAWTVNCIKLGLSPLWNFKLQTRSHFRDTWPPSPGRWHIPCLRLVISARIQPLIGWCRATESLVSMWPRYAHVCRPSRPEK